LPEVEGSGRPIEDDACCRRVRVERPVLRVGGEGGREGHEWGGVGEWVRRQQSRKESREGGREGGREAWLYLQDGSDGGREGEAGTEAVGGEGESILVLLLPNLREGRTDGRTEG